MKKLISMTDFVLDQSEILHKEQKNRNFNLGMLDFATNSIKYARFLKQPLELWMFVPCDKDGNVLAEKSIFNTTDEDYIFYSDDFDKYQKAKERCLFDGFELKGETEFSWIFKHNGIFPIMISKQRNIEYLVTILKREIELTQTAIK